jgi:hypothetical protein
MSTAHTPIDLDALLSLYFDPELSPPRIAKALGVPIIALSDELERPSVIAAIKRVAKVFDDRAKFISSASIEAVLRRASTFPDLPANPSPADQERLRRVLDSSRRAAELLFKLHTPPPIPRRAAAHPPSQPSAHAPAPLTPLDPNPSLYAALLASPPIPTLANAAPPALQSRLNRLVTQAGAPPQRLTA